MSRWITPAAMRRVGARQQEERRRRALEHGADVHRLRVTEPEQRRREFYAALCKPCDWMGPERLTHLEAVRDLDEHIKERRNARA